MEARYHDRYASNEFKALKAINNFPGYLPGGFYRFLYFQTGRLDTPFRDIVDVNRLNKREYSQDYLNQTPEELFELIDEILLDQGVSPDAVLILQKKLPLVEDNNQQYTLIMMRGAIAMPVYQELISRGVYT